MAGAVAGLVGNEGGVVSEVINLESSGVEAPDRRPRHDERLSRSLILRSLHARRLLIFSTIGSIRSRPRCAIGRGEFIEELIRGELDAALARPRYQRSKKAADEGRAAVTGHRHGSRTRSLTGHVRAGRDRGAARPA